MYKIKVTGPRRAEIVALLANATKSIPYTANMNTHTHVIEPGYSFNINSEATRIALLQGQEYNVGGCWATGNEVNPAHFTFNVTRILPGANTPCMQLTLLMKVGSDYLPVIKFEEAVTLADATEAITENCTWKLEDVASLNDMDRLHWEFDVNECIWNDLTFCSPMRLQIKRLKA